MKYTSARPSCAPFCFGKTPAVLFLCSALFGASLSAQSLISEYRFNETGTSAAGTGSNTTSLTFLDAGGGAADLHSSAGAGVSGRAFDNSAAVSMGGLGGQARSVSAVNAAYNGLTSFTITGWFKTAGTEGLGGGAVLVDLNGYGAVQLRGDAGRLQLSLGGQLTQTAPDVYSATQTWVFFAVSYDAASSQVNYYMGSEADGVALRGSSTISGTSSAVVDGKLSIGSGQYMVIGNRSDGARAFDGLIDDIRIYGDSSGSAGALGISELNDIRLSSIPEVSTASLILGAAAGMLVLARREIRN